MEKRTYIYMGQPQEYGLPCCACGDESPEWSEFKGYLWCARCQKDFIPAHGGIFDGPVPVNAMRLLGIDLRRYNLTTGMVENVEAPHVKGLLV